jgi:hypothetical protein
VTKGSGIDPPLGDWSTVDGGQCFQSQIAIAGIAENFPSQPKAREMPGLSVTPGSPTWNQSLIAWKRRLLVGLSRHDDRHRCWPVRTPFIVASVSKKPRGDPLDGFP